jgi:uncharacterized protein with PQ loop repeat
MTTELIGWTAAAILLATLGRQVYSQWRDRTSHGVSKWLFVGQSAASIGFVTYSWLVESWVFVATNALILLTALLGQAVYFWNKREQRER